MGGNDTLDSDANSGTGLTGCETLTSGENNLTYDAGLYQQASLGDFVWNDTNGNGVQDLGELGVSGVTVTLYQCSNGNVVGVPVITGPNGQYLFSGLTPGSYYVGFSNLPAGYFFTPNDMGGNDTADSDANSGTGLTGCETLTSGENNLTYDAGLQEASLDNCGQTIPLGCNPTLPTCATIANGTAPYGGAVTVSSGCGVVPITCDAGAITGTTCNKQQIFTFTAVACGKTLTCTRTFTWTVTEPVSILCAPDKTIECNSQFNFDLPTASGGCGSTPTITVVSTITNANGSKTRTWLASASCGGSATCSQTISVRSCSHIFPTQTTCCNYVTGTATGLYNVCTKVNGSGTTGGTVYNAVPGVMFYYSYVVAPASSFTIDVKQTNDGDLNKLFKIQNVSQVRLTTGSCGSISFAGSLINSGTGARYVVTGATPGATYVVSLKYDVKSIQGAVYSGPDRVSTYTFGCFINGSVSAATGTSGSIDAVWGCVDNTPLPGSCTLLSAKDGTIAIEEFSVRAYPNPYNDNFNLNFTTESKEIVQVSVYDMTGRLIERNDIDPSQASEINIGSKYSAGVYNVVVSQGTEVKTLRVVKR